MTPESNPQAATSSGDRTVRLSPSFNRIFLSVLGLTVLCLLVGCTLIGLTMRTGRDMTAQENAMLDLCTSMFKLGFGAIIGLLGGKAL